MNMELLQALDELEKERGLAREVILEAIETAVVAAYKKNYGAAQNVRVQFDPASGEVQVFSRRLVVDEVEDSRLEISLEEAKRINPNYEEDDIVEVEITPRDFGRIAAQTAKQVIMQKIREAEREIVYQEFNSRQDEIVTGIVARRERRNVLISLGRTEAVLPPPEQMPGEYYQPGMRLKVYVAEVRKTPKGPQIVVSRSHPGLLRRLFEMEVPEIADGLVEIRSVAREAGRRSKIAVSSRRDNIDPVGACVGTRGVRVQAVVNELRGERIDIVSWDADPAKFITNALSPARVAKVMPHPLEEEEKAMLVIVPDNQLSLAIGREGQNARLAARLTGFHIDIKSESQADEFFRALLTAKPEQGPQIGTEPAKPETAPEPEPVMEPGEAEPALAVELEPEAGPEPAEARETHQEDAAYADKGVAEL